MSACLGWVGLTMKQKADLRSLYYGVLSAPLLGLKMDHGVAMEVLGKVLDLLESDGAVR